LTAIADKKNGANWLDDLSCSSGLQIIPIGGLGEFGQNMMAYHCRGDMIIIDCGLSFPDPSLLGVDLVIPDFSFFKSYRNRIKAMIFTHGHEDHIGATPYFLQSYNPPMYATRFTCDLLRSKLEEHHNLAPAIIEEIEPGQTLELGCFSVSFLHVNHSICQAVSLAIDTPEGLFVHTGDFKIDATPTSEEVFDYSGFAELGQKGVAALLSDSTNATREGFTRSEAEVAVHLDSIFRLSENRLLVSLFSSSIPRIQKVSDLAIRYDRKIHFSGRSLINTTRIARKLGLLSIPDSIIATEEELKHLPKNKVLIIVTGSQGEPRSALFRIALGDHKTICVEEGDVVIFSSRIIPGHGRSVTNVINHLAMRGAEIFDERTRTVHTSGHAQRGELATMLSLTKPRCFIPIHGEYHQLREHANLAKLCGVNEQKVFTPISGEVLEFRNGIGQLIGKVPTGRQFVDGDGVGEVGPEEIRERRKIGHSGLVVCLFGVSPSRGEIIYGPEIFSRGFVFDDVSETLFEEAKADLVKMFDSLNTVKMGNLDYLKEEARIRVRRFFKKSLGRKPVVLPMVFEL